MRIVFYIGTIEEGGAQRVVSILSNELVERGFDVTVVKHYDGVNFYYLNDKVKIEVINNAIKLRKFFKNNADVVISFLAPFNMRAIFVNLFNSTPIIVADRNDPRRIPSNTILRKARDFLYLLADKIVVQTTYNYDYFSKTVQNKSVIIANPIEMNGNEGIGLNTPKEKVIVSVGRLMKQKNQTLLIDAFNDVVKDYPDYKLVIYGEGPYRPELEERVNESGISDKVVLPGNTSNVFKDISSAEVFVLSSDYEGMPNVLIEAMCSGIASVSTKVSGSTDLIVDGENGYLVDLGDRKQLSDKIKHLLSDKELRNRFAKNGSELAKELTPKNIGDKWIKIIEEVAKK